MQEAGAEPADGDDPDELAEKLAKLERRREALGSVNPLAKEEYEREKERLDELRVQRADLEASLKELEALRDELADTVERYVSMVRDRTTSKVVLLVRALVFGIIIAMAAVATVVLAIIVATKLTQRIVNVALRVDADSSVWVSYAVVGGLFTLLGFVLLKMRSPKEAPAT